MLKAEINVTIVQKVYQPCVLLGPPWQGGQYHGDNLLDSDDIKAHV